MFFTDELLMGKGGSLGIIWLVSTLGPRTKRVNRRALEKVEIPSTCDLIASPPEPLALRLSGQLLVGVARIYSQNEEHLYSDVKMFESALRRSITVDFGPMGKLAGGADLDLPGGGRLRLDQITFPQFEPGLEGYSGIDFEFANIDWLDPNLAGKPRNRRHTTPLDSLKTQSFRGEEAEEDDDIEESRGRHRYTIPNINNDKPPTYKPFVRPSEDIVDQFEPMDLDIVSPDLVNLDSDDTMPPGFNSDGPLDDVADTGDRNFDMVLPPPDVDPQDFILPDQVHNSPTRVKRKGSSSQEASDVESQLVPPPKPKKKKKTKRGKAVRFDDLDLDLSGMEAAYVDSMAEKRKGIRGKAREKTETKTADRLLMGADIWIQFLDPDMGEFVNDFSKVDKFKWQFDSKDGDGDGQQPIDLEPIDPVDPQLPNDDLPLDPQPIDDYPMDVFDIPDVPEPGRRDSSLDLEQGRSAGSDLPWMVDSDFSLPAPLASGQTTPQGLKTPRISEMSPLELSIRKHQRHSSITHDATGRRDLTGRDLTNRSRSGSVMSLNLPGLDQIQLVSDDNADDELPEDDLDKRFPPGHPFAPMMLATLEDQCRDFLSFVDKTMIKTGVDQLELTDLAPRRQSKRVVATAFHNCLTLATKRLLHLSQDDAYGPITIRIPPA